MTENRSNELEQLQSHTNAAVSRIDKYLTSLPDKVETSHLPQIKARRVRLDQLFEQYTNAHLQALKLGFCDDDLDIEEFETKYYNLIAQCDSLIQSTTANQISTSVDASTNKSLHVKHPTIIYHHSLETMRIGFHFLTHSIR